MSFRLDGAQAALRWLRQYLTQQQLENLASLYHQVWAYIEAGLQDNKQRLQQQFSLSDSEWAGLVYRYPVLLYSATAARDMAAWLQSGPARLSEGEVQVLFRRDPLLFHRDLRNVEKKLQLILERCALPLTEAKFVMTKGSSLVSINEETLQKKLATLEGHGEPCRLVLHYSPVITVATAVAQLYCTCCAEWFGAIAWNAGIGRPVNR